MNALVELIKRIGIFMIAAQAVIHFTPGQKYEKYIKLLVGMMILLQFVVPLHHILSGTESDWGAKMADMERMLEAESMNDMAADSSSVMDSVLNSLENEIKSRLNDEISGEDYVVSNVRVSMRAIDGNSESTAEAGRYELEKVRVVVYGGTASVGSRMDGSTGNMENTIEKIQIEKISVGSTADSGEQIFGDTDGSASEYGEETDAAHRLRERFCAVLGMNEENMEVSVYGTNEKTDR